MFQHRFHRRDVTLQLLRDKCERLGFRVGSRKPWTAAQDAQLRALYFDTPGKAMARRLGHSLSSTYQRARKLGLERNPEALRELGRRVARSRAARKHQFKKGHAPANKGLRRPGWFAGRMRETQFKKGVRSGKAAQHFMPVGTTRIIEGYQYTKISDVPNVPYTVNWKPTHVLQWEAAHGRPVPPKHALKCLDGNRLNLDPANWACIHRSVLCRLNKSGLDYDHAPAELRPTILALAKTRAALGARRRQATTRATRNRSP
jgi:hypothetical protein